jgi:hypothetical protein
MTDRWRPLFLWALAVAAVWCALHLLGVVGSRWGLYALVAGGVVYANIVVVMLVGTRRWTARGLGLMCALLVDAYLFGRLLGATALGWVDPPGRLERELSWALFIVGGVLLTWGILDWWRERWDESARHDL